MKSFNQSFLFNDRIFMAIGQPYPLLPPSPGQVYIFAKGYFLKNCPPPPFKRKCLVLKMLFLPFCWYLEWEGNQTSTNLDYLVLTSFQIQYQCSSLLCFYFSSVCVAPPSTIFPTGLNCSVCYASNSNYNWPFSKAAPLMILHTITVNCSASNFDFRLDGPPFTAYPLFFCVFCVIVLHLFLAFTCSCFYLTPLSFLVSLVISCGG